MKRFYSFFLTALLGMVALTASAVKVTVNVDDASRVVVKVNGTEQDVTTGTNVYEVEKNQSISMEATEGNFLTKIVQGSTGTDAYISQYKSYSYYVYQDQNEEFTVTSVAISDVRTASVTVKVDDASKVRMELGGTRSSVVLQNGDNTVYYIPEAKDGLPAEVPFQLMSSSNVPLYKVSVDGEEVEPTYTYWTITPKEGSTIEIEANYPDQNVPVTFTYSSEEAKGFVTGVSVNGTPVSNYNDANFTVKAGSSVTISGNTTDYKFESMTVGGQQISYFSGSYSFIVKTDAVSVDIVAHKYAMIKGYINVEHPEYIKAYKGGAYDYDKPELTLVPGRNEIEVSEKSATVSFQPASGCFITSIKDQDGNAYSADWSGYYQITLTEGMELTVDAGAIERNETAVVYLDAVPASLPALRYLSLEGANRYVINDLTKGYNAINFYSGDNPFTLSWYYDEGSYSNVYLNGVKVEPKYPGSLVHELQLKDGDVVKVYPTVANLSSYNVDVEVTGEGLDKLVVKTDSIHEETNWQAGIKVLPRTMVSVEPAAGYTILSITVDGETVEPNEDGQYVFTVTADTKVAVENHRIRPVNATVEVDDLAAVTVYEGDVSEGRVIDLQEGENLLEYDEETAINIVAGFDYSIVSVSDESGAVYNANYDGSYTVVLKEGMSVKVETAVIERDLTAVVYVDDCSASEYIKFIRQCNYPVGLESGYNIVKFNDEVDNAFDLSWSANYSNVYLNGESVAPVYDWSTIYSLNLADGDVVKIYLASNPESHSVAFNVGEGVDESVTLTCDLIHEEADWQNGLSVLPGTQISLSGNIVVTVDGNVVEADENGQFTFTVNADTKVSVSLSGADGIGSLDASKYEKADIYSLSGVCIMRNATADGINGLPAGLYIVNGKKVIKR